MSPGEKLKVKLAADTAVTALVGDRIFPNELPPQTPLPALVYQVVDELPDHTFDSVPATVLRHARVQIDAYDRDYDTARAVADAVSDCLHGPFLDGLVVLEIDSRDLRDTELKAHRVSRDFSVWCGR